MRKLVGLTMGLALTLTVVSAIASANISVTVENPFTATSPPVVVGYELAPDLEIYVGLRRDV